MVRKFDDLRITIVDEAKGGSGKFINAHILEKEEFADKGRLYAKCKLAPNDSVGSHVHIGEMEICHFISGTGTVVENGIEIPVSAGDTNIVGPGENHAVINTGNEELIYTALIIYT